MPVDKSRKTFSSQYAHDFAGYLLLCQAGRDIFLVSAEGLLTSMAVVPGLITFVLAVLILHDNAPAKFITIVKAFFGLFFVLLISDAVEFYSSAWYEAISIQFLGSASLILLLIGHKYRVAFMFGAVLGALYLIYLALTIFIRVNA